MTWARALGLAAIAVIAFAVYVVLEPVSIFGYDGDALAESLQDEAPDGYGLAECEKRPGQWRCSIEEDPGSGSAVIYQLTVNDDGCWEGRPDPSRAPANQKDVSGCVGLLDLMTLEVFETK